VLKFHLVSAVAQGFHRAAYRRLSAPLEIYQSDYTPSSGLFPLRDITRRGKVIDVVERLTDMADNILRLPEAIYSECSGLKSDRSRILEVARNFRLVGATYL